MKKLITLFLFLSSTIAFTCKKTPGSQTKTGIAKGKVTDTQGRPIAGATVVINNTVFFNKNIVVTTDNKGEYSVPMPPADSWYVRGSVQVNYHGRVYELPLHPDFAGSFTGMEDKTVNLQWKMTGEVPTDFGHSGYYGGKVIAKSVLLNLPDMFRVQLTLEPQGALIDGSTGVTILQTCSSHHNEFIINEVPIGKYKITAKKINVPLYLNPANGDPLATYVSSLMLDFEPSYSGATTYKIGINLSATP